MKFSIALLLLALAFVGGPIPLLAQAAASVPAAVPPDDTAFGQALLQAAAQFKAGQTAMIAATLAQSCTQQTGGANWHMQMAARYLHLRQIVADSADADGINSLSQLALGESQLAAKSGAGNTAGALELAGYIYERFLGDRASAKASYQAAVATSPDAVEAQKALDRLTQEDAAVTLKLNAAQGK